MSNINPITTQPNGILDLDGVKAWENAMDVVDYPVDILPLCYKNDLYNGGCDGEEEYNPAMGDTNTGRDTEFFGVVVDRNRTGERQVIATVTGTYGTLNTKQVYHDLRQDLIAEGLKAAPVRVYVSGNGGRAVLNVAIDDTEVKVGDQKIKMHLNLDTSVDGTKKHTMRLAVLDEDGVEIVGMGEKTFTIGAKHTTSISERHASFQTVLVKLAGEWQTNIEPMLAMMNDCVFDRNLAVDIFKEIMTNAEIPERHIKNAVDSYAPNQNENMFGVLRGISVYLSGALNDKPERLEAFREKINKKSRKLIEQTINSFKKGSI